MNITKLLDWTAFIVVILLYISIIAYIKIYPHYTIYSPEGTDYIEGIAPTLDCDTNPHFMADKTGAIFIQHKSKLCLVKNLPTTQDNLYMRFHFPFLYYVIMNQAWILLGIIIFALRGYIAKDGITRFKIDLKEKKTFWKESFKKFKDNLPDEFKDK